MIAQLVVLLCDLSRTGFKIASITITRDHVPLLQGTETIGEGVVLSDHGCKEPKHPSQIVSRSVCILMYFVSDSSVGTQKQPDIMP